MSFSYDLSTSVGQVRNLIGDVDATNYQLTDEEITSFLSISSGDLFSAAAFALRRIAGTKALLAKRVSAGNYSEDTTSVAKGLLEVAQILQDAANAIPADAQVEIIHDNFNYQTILRNKALRGESLSE